jgi:hypothetical protein
VGAAVGGCVRGSLATSTGPNGPHTWCADNRQKAHVGEKVRFSFILINPLMDRPIDPYGYADYCMATVGEDRIQCEPDLGGRFRFEHQLADLEPGRTIQVKATVYRQYGSRDFMQVGEDWMRGESRFDEPDPKVRSDSLSLRIYQAEVEIKLPGGPAPFDFESGKLELVRSDGSISSVYLDRPKCRGFTVEGPDEHGAHTIRYLPQGTEVNPSGQTEARFAAYDLAGQRHTASTMVPTP